MSKRKILTMAMALCMAAILVVGGSLAFFTDTEEKTNVFTAGNVQIVQEEKDRKGEDYGDETKKLYPIVDDAKDDGLHSGKNYIDKFVTVTNTGSEDAYVRTFLAIPAALDNGPTTFDASKNILHWNAADASWDKTLQGRNYGYIKNEDGTYKTTGMANQWYWDKTLEVAWPTVEAGQTDMINGYVTNIGGTVYYVYVATHKTAIVPNETTAPSLFGVYLDEKVDYVVDTVITEGEEPYTGYVLRDQTTKQIISKVDFDLGGDVEVLVKTEAVQAKGFEENDAVYALNKAFGTVGSYCPFGGTVQSVFPNLP